MITKIVVRLSFSLLAILWMVGEGHAEVGRSVSSSAITVQLEQTDQVDTGSWVDQMPGNIGSHGKVNESLIERTVRSVPTVQAVIVAGNEAGHNLVISQSLMSTSIRSAHSN